MSIEPFNNLVKLVGRAFYDDITEGDNQPKTGRSDNRGIGVVVLDALTRRQWVSEEDLAKDLKLDSKQLCPTLEFFEKENLVTRDRRRQTFKGAKMHNAAVAATVDGLPATEGEEKVYCCLNYGQILNVVRYRLQHMKQTLKDELGDNTVQEYACLNCGKRYSAFDALQLVSAEEEYFHCESCNGKLVAENNKLASQEVGDGDDDPRRRRLEKLEDMLQKIKSVTDQLNTVQGLVVPQFGDLRAWLAQAGAAKRAENKYKMYAKAFYSPAYTKAQEDAKKELKSSETRDSDGPFGMYREEALITGNEENYRVNDLVVEADAAAAAEDEDDIDWEEG